MSEKSEMKSSFCERGCLSYASICFRLLISDGIRCKAQFQLNKKKKRAKNCQKQKSMSLECCLIDCLMLSLSIDYIIPDMKIVSFLV